MLASAPAFLARLPLSRAAWEYTCGVHDGQTRVSDGAPFIEHPREVALLLDTVGARDPLVAAGLLHDTVERTATTPSDLAQSTRCGMPPRPRLLNHCAESLLSLEAVIAPHPLVCTLRRELAPLTSLSARAEVVPGIRTRGDAVLSRDS